MVGELPKHLKEKSVKVMGKDGRIKIVKGESFSPVLSDKLIVEKCVVDMQSLLIRGACKMAHDKRIQASLNGYGDNVIQAAHNRLMYMAQECFDREDYKNGIKLYEVYIGYIAEKPKSVLETRNTNLNVNVEDQSFREKLKIIERIKRESKEVESDTISAVIDVEEIKG